MNPVHSPCLICSGSHVTSRPLNDARALIFCRDCRNSFTLPPPDPGQFRLPYENEKIRGQFFYEILVKFFMRLRVARICNLTGRRRGLKLLDVGAGACRFANECLQAGFETWALEPNEGNRIFAQEGVHYLAHPFTREFLDKRILKAKSFDVITMWHSLEHFPDTKQAASLAKDLLKPGGVLWISVPNIESLQFQVSGSRWTYLDVDHHYTHFSIRGLKKFLGRYSFEIVRGYVFSAEYEIFGWVQTLLNLATGSTNYLYEKYKYGKHRQEQGLRKAWIQIVSLLWPLLGIPAIMLSFLAAGIGKPSCAEVAFRKSES